MFDVIISGGGPAGAVAATVLARAGARVLVCDRATFPRDKLCGDTVNPGTLATLRRLRLSERIEPHALRTDGMILTGERGALVRGSYGRGIYGLAIPRRELDAALLEEASSAGARIEQKVLVRRPLVVAEGTRVRVRGVVIAGAAGRDIRIPAPLIIAADGRRSRVALALGLLRHPLKPRRWAIGAYIEGIEGLGHFGEMHVRREHYMGVAPLPSGLANVCLVTANRHGFNDPGRVLEHAVVNDWYLAERFQQARLASRPVVVGPLAVDAVARNVPGLLLAGDAAGFVDPMTGDGLRFALRGGELAAQAALDELGSGRPAYVRLDALRRQEFATKWRINRALRLMVGSPAAVGFAAAMSNWWSAPVEHLIHLAGDVPLARRPA
jgi:flavin-dependent dehydrogenase